MLNWGGLFGLYRQFGGVQRRVRRRMLCCFDGVEVVCGVLLARQFAEMVGFVPLRPVLVSESQ
jgi:hypothetical protein